MKPGRGPVDACLADFYNVNLVRVSDIAVDTLEPVSKWNYVSGSFRPDNGDVTSREIEIREAHQTDYEVDFVGFDFGCIAV